MKKSALLAAISFMACVTAFAQGKFQVSGTVIEKETNEAVVSATTQLLSLPDSTFVTGTVTSAMGVFEFKNVKKAKYTLKISYIGFLTKYVDLDLTTKKDKNVDLGYITLASDAVQLKAAEVTGHAAKVTVSGDSMVYNASAYRVPEGSTLEALVKQLPGAKVDSEGNITINGKTVNKILVDGKEFFLNDKSVAMKNIPTEMIDKIKSYDRKSDLSRVTGIDDGEEETVLDLSVKKGMMNGWFGNVNLGAGTEDRYSERLNVNRFNDNFQATLIGNANNTSDMGFGGGGGRGWGWGGGGLRNSKEIGANFATTNTKLETGGSLRFRYDGADNYNESSSEDFNATKGKFSESKSKSLSSNSSVRGNFRLEWKPDTMTNIIFRPNLSYSRNRGFSNSSSGSYDEDPNDITDNALSYNDKISRVSAGDMDASGDAILQRLVDIVATTNTSRSQSYSTNFNLDGELQANRKFNSKGRNLTLRVTGGYSDGNSKQLSAANITYNTLGTNQQNNRYYYTPSKSNNISSQVTYSEPIANKTYAQFSYRFDYSYSKNDRKAQVYDSQAYQDLAQALTSYRYNIKAILRFMDDSHFERRDTAALSQFSEYKNYTHRIGVSLRQVRDTYNASIGVDAIPQHSVLNYKYMGHEYPEVTRNVFDIAPRINLRFNSKDKRTSLHFRYNGRTSQPSMTNLLDIVDDSNPLYITKGNTHLKPSFSQNINAFFNTYNTDAQRGIFAHAYFSTTHNSISNKTTYDSETGVRTTQPMNINGNWNVGTGAGFNTGLGKKKLFNIGVDAGFGFNHNVAFYNNATGSEADDTDLKSITKDLSADCGLDFSYRNDFLYVSLNGRLDYSNAKNNMNENANQSTYDFSYGAEVEWTAPWGMSISSDIGMNSRRGYSQSTMNTNELLWNAQISQSFLRGNALTIALEVNDILGEQSNISRTISALMRSDSKYNAIYQYGMLRVIYKFSIFGGKNAMGTDNERSSGWGGGWGGPGRW